MMPAPERSHPRDQQRRFGRSPARERTFPPPTILSTFVPGMSCEHAWQPAQTGPTDEWCPTCHARCTRDGAGAIALYTFPASGYSTRSDGKREADPLDRLRPAPDPLRGSLADIDDEIPF